MLPPDPSVLFIFFPPPLILSSSYIDSTSVNAVILSGRVLTGILLGGIVCVYVCVKRRDFGQ